MPRCSVRIVFGSSLLDNLNSPDNNCTDDYFDFRYDNSNLKYINTAAGLYYTSTDDYYLSDFYINISYDNSNK